MGDILLSELSEIVEPTEEALKALEEDLADEEGLGVEIEVLPTSDPIRQYLNEIGQVPLLTAEEEILLARRMEEGQEAIRKLSEASGLEEALIERALRAKLAGAVRVDGLPGLRDTISLEEAEAVLARLKALPKPEKRLLFLAQEGERARLQMIEANLRLVVHVAKRWTRRVKTLDFPDLISAGNRGLLKAVEKFTWRKGNKFSTYAYWWIEQAIRRTVADEDRTVRLPAYMGEILHKLYKAIGRLEGELGREPTLEEIAREMGPGWDGKRVEETLSYAQGPLSLDTPVGEEEDTFYGDFFEGNLPSPQEHAERGALEEWVEELLSGLPDRQALVLRLRYGLDGGKPRTLDEVGEILQVSRERVRQLEKKALRKIKYRLARNPGLQAFLD